tara:strand:+ start:5217 stop:5399 length:183 start_codon:yes stop_codon:yes gene_type:complete
MSNISKILLNYGPGKVLTQRRRKIITRINTPYQSKCFLYLAIVTGISKGERISRSKNKAS